MRETEEAAHCNCAAEQTHPPKESPYSVGCAGKHAFPQEGKDGDKRRWLDPEDGHYKGNNQTTSVQRPWVSYCGACLFPSV